MSNNKTLKLADFSRFPSGRDQDDGDFHGQRYRKEILQPALTEAINNNTKLIVSLEGVLNFGSSFLEEAFGGLIRTGVCDYNQVKKTLEIVPNDHSYGRYVAVIDRHMKNAKPE